MLRIRGVFGNFPFPQQTLTKPRVEKFTNLSNMLGIIRKLVVGEPRVTRRLPASGRGPLVLGRGGEL